MQANFKNGEVLVKMSHAEFEEFFKRFDSSKRAQERPQQQGISTNNLEQEVTTILSHLGIPRNILGFNYIRESIVLSVHDQNYINNITKALYPAIATKFSTKPSRVERAIRHGIETCWGEHAMKTLNMYCGSMFKPGSGKPTNSEFIALIVDSLKLKGLGTNEAV
jgi:two-component system response regulator (stage 0 sporulation protein A)